MQNPIHTHTNPRTHARTHARTHVHTHARTHARTYVSIYIYRFNTLSSYILYTYVGKNTYVEFIKYNLYYVHT